MAETRGKRPTDEVTEASEDSFPASDPPAFTSTHSGAPQEPPSRPKAGDDRLTLSGREACQARINLRTPTARWVFVGGIALALVVAAIVAVI